MTVALVHGELDCFRNAIRDRLGLQFDDGKLDFLADLLNQRLGACGVTSAGYWEMLASNSHQEWRVLATRLSVPETYFFRNSDQFRAVKELALPQRMSVRGNERRLRLLSAGCASGEEPYSLAITVRDRFPEAAWWDVVIRAVDMNPAVIEKAVRARYSAWSLRETAPEVRTQYFRTENGNFILDEPIRRMVKFEERNIVGHEPPEWSNEEFDIIFCRNMMMYLAPESMQRVVERLTRALARGGFLFLGHAETLRGLSHDFHLCHTHNTFYYQRRSESEPSPSGRTAGRPQSHPCPHNSSPDLSWVDIIGTATARIRELVQHRGAHPGAAAAVKSVRREPPMDFGLVLELLRQEKFREALDVLRELAPDSPADTDTQLLRAVLLTNCGETQEAEAVCAALLAADDLNAAAHYLMALCREQAGDRVGAMEQNRLAVHLDPDFAIPHLHLGLLAQRSGDLATARQELQQAVSLLLREDISRILLFGGGFGREALLAFSRDQLRACGGLS